MSTVPDSSRPTRGQARNARTPIERKPPWIRSTARLGPRFRELSHLVRDGGLHTVCQEAGCPNIFECWEDREATFLIGGETCTRRCDFCQIRSGRPDPLDTDEPVRVAESIRTMGLRYATVTGVTRDDLPDEGAGLYAETVRAVHRLNPGTGVEILVPDFSARPELLDLVFAAEPEVFAHNLETVPRLFRGIRPAFDYRRSLDVLRRARTAGLVTKSNLILGLGETTEEIHRALSDLRGAGCDLLTLTQYLRPSPRHHPVHRWLPPEEFGRLRETAEQLGFAGVMAGPLVRSSYRAGRLWAQAMHRTGRPVPARLAHLARSGSAHQEVAAPARSATSPGPRRPDTPPDD
jgi:lipoic acid synthetase